MASSAIRTFWGMDRALAAVIGAEGLRTSDLARRRDCRTRDNTLSADGDNGGWNASFGVWILLMLELGKGGKGIGRPFSHAGALKDGPWAPGIGVDAEDEKLGCERAKID